MNKWDKIENVPELKKQASELLASFENEETSRAKEGKMPPILYAIERGEVTKEQLKAVILIRYQLSHYFEEMLQRIINNIRNNKNLTPAEKEKMIDSVQKNLDDELGKSDYGGGPHREGRKELLEFLGVNYDEWVKSLGSYDNLGELNSASREIIEGLKRIIDKSPVGALAMLMYYEARISLHGFGDYYKILSGLQKVFGQDNSELVKEKYREDDPFWHIYSHADHDDSHAQLAKDGVLSGVRGQQDIESIRSALLETKEVFDKFWNMVKDESESRRISKTLVSVLRNPFPENSFRKTEFIFSERLISSHLSRLVDCVPRFSPLEKLCIIQACVARARHAGVLYEFLIK